MNYIWALLVVLWGTTLAYGGEIRVRVSNARGEAVAGATVAVTAIGGRRNPAGRVGRVDGSTGPDGAHTLTGLEPGAYILMVFVPSEQAWFRQPVALRSPSSAVEVDFRLPPAAQPPRSGNE